MEKGSKKPKVANGVASASKDQYAAAYLKHGITHGITYQVKILTWVVWKLLCKGDIKANNWHLGTEVRNARGFHDLVLKYDVDDASCKGGVKRMYRFVQIKHKLCLNDGVKISVSSMKSKQKKNQYSLLYLFKSYLTMLANFEEITPDQIVDMTVFTNVDVGAIQFLIPLERDKLLGFEGKGKRYGINLSIMHTNPGIIASLEKIMPNSGVLILDFLSKLVFAVDQPSESMLEELITKEMGKVFSVPQIFYNDLFKNMIEWFLIYDNGSAPYLTQELAMRYMFNAQNTLLKAKATEKIHVPDASLLSDILSLLKI